MTMTTGLETHTHAIHLTTDNDHRTPSYKFYENDTARYPLRTTFFIESLVPPPRIHSLQRSLHYQCFSATAFLHFTRLKQTDLPTIPLHSSTPAWKPPPYLDIMEEKGIGRNRFQSSPNRQNSRNYNQNNTLNFGSMSMSVRQNLVFWFLSTGTETMDLLWYGKVGVTYCYL